MKKWLFLFLCIYQSVTCAGAAGKILFTSKEVVAEKNNQQRVLKRGSEFFEGDTINTKVGALAQLQYTNGTLVSLQPNSAYKVLAYNDAPNAVNSAALTKGGLESSTLGQKKEILNTPLVSLAIAGTKYRTGIFCNHGKCKKVAVEVTEGLVIVDNRFPLGPNEQQNSGIYNANTRQMTYGPVNWSANGWVSTTSSSAGNGNGQGFVTTDLLTQVVNATAVNSATNGIINGAVTATGVGACPCC